MHVGVSVSPCRQGAGEKEKRAGWEEEKRGGVLTLTGGRGTSCHWIRGLRCATTTPTPAAAACPLNLCHGIASSSSSPVIHKDTGMHGQNQGSRLTHPLRQWFTVWGESLISALVLSSISPLSVQLQRGKSVGITTGGGKSERSAHSVGLSLGLSTGNVFTGDFPVWSADQISNTCGRWKEVNLRLIWVRLSSLWCWGEVVKGDFGQCLWNVLTLRDDSVSLENFEHKKNVYISGGIWVHCHF